MLLNKFNLRGHYMSVGPQMMLVAYSWIVCKVRDRCLGCIITFLKAAELDESCGGISNRAGKYSAGVLENFEIFQF